MEGNKMALSLFGGVPSDFPSYQKTSYQNFNPASYGGGMGTAYQNATNQQLSGQLSPEMLKQLNLQFGQNLATIRQGAYGMPIGAEKGMEGNLASSTALQGLLMGQNQIAQGQNAAMGYLNMGQNENQFGQSYNQKENQFDLSNRWNQEQSASSGGLMGSLINAGVQYGMGWLPKPQTAMDNMFNRMGNSYPSY